MLLRSTTSYSVVDIEKVTAKAVYFNYPEVANSNLSHSATQRTHRIEISVFRNRYSAFTYIGRVASLEWLRRDSYVIEKGRPQTLFYIDRINHGRVYFSPLRRVGENPEPRDEFYDRFASRFRQAGEGELRGELPQVELFDRPAVRAEVYHITTSGWYNFPWGPDHISQIPCYVFLSSYNTVETMMEEEFEQIYRPTLATEVEQTEDPTVASRFDRVRRAAQILRYPSR